MVNAVAFVLSGVYMVAMRCVGLYFDWRDTVLSWVAGLKGVVYMAKDCSCTCCRVYLVDEVDTCFQFFKNSADLSTQLTSRVSLAGQMCLGFG